MSTAVGRKVAVVLSGCGVYDGSEVHEASAVMTHLSRAGAEVSIYAPDKVFKPLEFCNFYIFLSLSVFFKLSLNLYCATLFSPQGPVSSLSILLSRINFTLWITPLEVR